MAKKKKTKWRVKTLSAYEQITISSALEDRIEHIDQDLKTLADMAYPTMEPENVDDVEHQLRRIRAEFARVKLIVDDADRLMVRKRSE